MAHDLKCTIGNHLVGIHVHRCTGTTLHHIDGEVFMPLSVDEFATGLRDGTCYLVVNNPKRVISLHRSQLHIGDGLDEVWIHRHRLTRDVIIVDATLRLHTV